MNDEITGWIHKAEADYQAALDQFGTDIRYPGVSASAQDARQAFDALKQVRAFVRARLGLA